MTRSTTKKAAAKAAESNTEATPAEETQPTKAEPETLSRDEALRQSYGTATRLLQEEYRTRFNELRTQEAAKLGHEWRPKPTEAERREQALRDLIKADPDAARRLLAEQGVTTSSEEG